MQFQYNADYPGISGIGHPPPAVAQDPREFPPAQPIPCARITTRVFHPNRNQVSTVENVLVRTMMPSLQPAGESNRRGSLSSSMDSDSDSDSSIGSDDESMKMEGEQLDGGSSGQTPQTSNAAAPVENAYWVQRTIREAIYGRVLFAVVLRRRSIAETQADGAEWEVTTDHCAVKEMSWQHIRRERDRLAEDPIKEVSAMQFLKQWFEQTKQLRKQLQQLQPHLQQIQPQQLSSTQESFLAMRETNIMMPLDLLSDERNLYSIMPYCDGGELFERLDLNERFSEGEARYWMDQVLNVSDHVVFQVENLKFRNLCQKDLTPLPPDKYAEKGIENLQHCGICHRDMSLENLLVHKDGALIIDMGMCLLIPLQDATGGPASIAESFSNLSMNGTLGGAAVGAMGGAPAVAVSTASNLAILSGRARPRYMMRPQGTCGKWIYMSPEVYQNSDAFDGYAVDMWAAGVILFLMLTGFPPWERACQTDDRFKYMTAGYLVQMLTEWELGLSSDAMDLLQRMLFLDPKDRLSLDQVRAHPWMANGHREMPMGLGS